MGTDSPRETAAHDLHLLEHSQMVPVMVSERDDGSAVLDLVSDETIVLRIHPDGKFSSYARRPNRPVALVVPEDDGAAELARRWAEEGVPLTVEAVTTEGVYVRIAVVDPDGLGWAKGSYPLAK